MAEFTAAPHDINAGISQFYVPATPLTSLDSPQTLKADDSFLVADRFGDFGAEGPSAEGLYHEDTRYLSHFAVNLNGSRPLLLGSGVGVANDSFRADFTNPDVYVGDSLILARDTVHLLRTNQLLQATLEVRIELRNFAAEPSALEVTTEYASDFADIFEVRGMHRGRRGTLLTEMVGPSGLTLGYRGLDGVSRSCRIAFSVPPAEVTEKRALHRIMLQPHGSASFRIIVSCHSSDEGSSAGSPIARNTHVARPHVLTSKELLNGWIARSQADLDMLLTQTVNGCYPYAGIPWFSAAFGRDGIIAALQCLWLRPDVARGVLEFLAATQATTFDRSVDAEPGKILHEARHGEMAALGEVPFRRYYGSVDATPLFVMLATAYWDRTGDTALLRDLWPHVRAALDWMRYQGDRDGDGFIEYVRHTELGLRNQGWKDSSDSIFHSDGALAEPPIALVEVQAYAYAALAGAARLAAALGLAGEATEFVERAEQLKQRFEATFWCEDLSTYALALDREKRPCRVRASNAGHVLLAGIAAPDRARKVAATLMSPDGFSGWGIRTLAEGVPRYNPMSYHNGSVWPHDNGLIALGFARYGLTNELLRLTEGMFAASQCMELHRLPELFCGFSRDSGRVPIRYPVACIPQAWSAATVFGMLGALLGVSFDSKAARVHVTRPILPDYVDALRITHLPVGEGSMDLLLRRHIRDVAVNVLGKKGEGELVLTSG